jgi:hypothetical protein
MMAEMICEMCGLRSLGNNDQMVRRKSCTLQVNLLVSLLLDVSRMLPPERSPCKMLRLCKYARALAISFAVSLHGANIISETTQALSAFLHSHQILITGQKAYLCDTEGRRPSRPGVAAPEALTEPCIKTRSGC